MLIRDLRLDAFPSLPSEDLEGANAAHVAVADRRRRSARPRCRRDRELRRARLRHLLCDELRRSAAPLSTRRVRSSAPLAVPGLLARRVGLGARDRSDCRTHGPDEGYFDLNRDRRDSFLRASSPRPCRPRCAARPRLTCSLGVATSKVVAKVASDSRKPGGITVVLPGREPVFLAPLAVRKLPGVARAAQSDSPEPASKPWATCRVDGRRAATPPARQGRGRITSAIVPRHRRARARDIVGTDLHLNRRDVRARRQGARATAIRGGARRMAERLSEHLRRDGQAARTVTTKVRYPDFAIRSRSLTLDVAVDDAGDDRRSGVQAPRPRARRPAGALRVGVFSWGSRNRLPPAHAQLEA